MISYVFVTSGGEMEHVCARSMRHALSIAHSNHWTFRAALAEPAVFKRTPRSDAALTVFVSPMQATPPAARPAHP